MNCQPCKGLCKNARKFINFRGVWEAQKQTNLF
ncbi:hypothetical protein J3D54_004331 [Pseudomonas sp. GGS8]|nr:hypothetical protein [Pseudomonas sp. GGS8]